MIPACMAEDEYALWREGNAQTHGWQRADSPCRDCTPLFHADMVAGGMCNGTPGGDSPHDVGGRPRLPSEAELRRMDYASLRALRATLPLFDPPEPLRLALQRARWREFQVARRRRMV